MEAYKQEFIEFMVDSHVLKFGEFTLKSGRKSPFFMNAGAYVTGSQLRRLGQVPSLRNSENIMQRRSTTNTVMTLMCCSDRLTREFRSA